MQFVERLYSKQEYNQQLNQKISMHEAIQWQSLSKIVLKYSFKKSRIPLIDVILSSIKKCYRVKKIQIRNVVTKPKSQQIQNRNSFFKQAEEVQQSSQGKGWLQRRPTLMKNLLQKNYNSNQNIDYGKTRRHSEGQLNQKIKDLNFLESKTYVKQHLQPKKPILKQKKHRLSIKTRQIVLAQKLGRSSKAKIKLQKVKRVQPYSPQVRSNKVIEVDKMSLSGVQEPFKTVNIGKTVVAPLSEEVTRVLKLVLGGRRMRKKTQIIKPLPLVKQKSMNISQRKQLLMIMNSKSRNQISSQESSEDDTFCRTPVCIKKSQFKSEKNIKVAKQNSFNIYYFKSNKTINDYVCARNGEKQVQKSVSPRTLRELMIQPSTTSSNPSKRVKTETTTNEQIQRVYAKQEMVESEYYVRRKTSLQVPSLKLGVLKKKSGDSKEKFKPYTIKSSRKL